MLEIGLGVREGNEVNVLTESFNPCFVGNRSGRLLAEHRMNFVQYVSILVLLEIGLGVRKRHFITACIVVSILVLLEIGLGAVLGLAKKP